MNNLFASTFVGSGSQDSNLIKVDASFDSNSNILLTGLFYNKFPEDCALSVYNCFNKKFVNFQIHLATEFDCYMVSISALQHELTHANFKKNVNKLFYRCSQFNKKANFNKKVLFQIGANSDDLLGKFVDYFICDLSDSKWERELSQYVFTS